MKYIIELPEEPLSIVALSIIKGILIATKIETFEPYIEPDRKAIEDEVWEFAKKVRLEEFIDEEGRLHGYISGFNSYSEAKAKHEELKKSEDEICIGDEVIPLDTQYDTMVVTKLWTSEYCDEWVDTIAGDGKTYNFLKTSITKTGRHFPEVAELLKKMRSESHEHH